MSISKPRRRWVVLAVLVVIVIASIRALDRTMPIENYRVVDQQTLAVEIVTGPGSWTRVTGVTETPSSVTITVSSLQAPLPGSAVGLWLELTVKLSEPLGNRSVVDGRSGRGLGLTPSPWPPMLGP
jgi:hypothetical protein